LFFKIYIDQAFARSVIRENDIRTILW